MLTYWIVDLIIDESFVNLIYDPIQTAHYSGYCECAEAELEVHGRRGIAKVREYGETMLIRFGQ